MLLELLHDRLVTRPRKAKLVQVRATYLGQIESQTDHVDQLASIVVDKLRPVLALLAKLGIKGWVSLLTARYSPPQSGDTPNNQGLRG
jgi:hypothetical protein